MNRNTLTPSQEEQIRYARILQFLSLSGLLVLVVGFCIYMSGLVPVVVPVEQIPGLLGLRAKDFIQKTGMSTGWKWVGNLHKGEVISNLGVIYLSLATIICFLAIFPVVVRKKDSPYIIIILLELLVLILAACGVVTVGAH